MNTPIDWTVDQLDAYIQSDDFWPEPKSAYELLLEKAKQLEKDAERYRWWRARFCGGDASMDEINDAFRNGADSPDEVDAAIDAAMTKPHL